MACARSATCSLVKVLGQERVAKREPEKAERDASPSIGTEQEREEREVRDEQHTNPAWQHPRSQGGYAQQREPASQPRTPEMKTEPRTASPSASSVMTAITVIAHRSAVPRKATMKPVFPSHP